MEWKDWLGKHVFVQLFKGGVYSGKIIDIDESAKPLIFITIIDKYGMKVMFVQSEILKIAEEEEK